MTRPAASHPDNGVDTRLVLVDASIAQCWQPAARRDYDAIVSSIASSTPVSDSRATCCRRLELPEGGNGLTAYLKVYRGPTGLRPRWVRDKATIEARNYSLLRERCGVGVPRVLAYGCRRSRWRVLDAFILTEAVAGAAPLDEYMRQRWPAGPPRSLDPQRRRLLAATAEFVARLHAARFCHIDLQWRNLLARDAESGPILSVIDCVRGGLRNSAVRWWHGRLRDLSSLYKLGRCRLSRTEQIRWLRAYLGVRRLRPEDRLLVQAVLFDRRLKDHHPDQPTAASP